ncbi:MAG: BMP family ABC transporter substrate-binding protein, partial [Clostridia bacterium]|nr:BMP family ABC transporter substrate-binding protein [Clostridia bacterium]
MKKVITLLLIVSLLLGLGVTMYACKPVDDTFEVALVTDVGNIDDKSFNEGAWNGVKQYAEANNKTYAYYRPSEDSEQSRLDAIEAAVNGGAKIIVCPGYLFEVVLFEAQATYPNVAFLLLDGEPNDGNWGTTEAPAVATYRTDDNVHNILYKEEQSGFLAGYGAVMDGMRKLGFIGGIDVPAVIRFGHGYVQGAEAAAVELGLANGAVQMNYWYSGTFGPRDDIRTKAAQWY